MDEHGYRDDGSSDDGDRNVTRRELYLQLRALRWELRSYALIVVLTVLGRWSGGANPAGAIWRWF
jgi:hypothetical protein